MKVDVPRRAGITALVAIFVGVVAPAFSFADEAAERKAEAQRLFAEGQAALDKGDNASGCALMRTSLELFAVANSLFTVAQCDQREGKLASALEHWQRGLSLIDATDKRSPVVKKSIEDLSSRAPRVRIVVEPNDAPVEVMLDGEVVPSDKLVAALFVDPGKHEITVSKAGHADRRVKIVLGERERTEVVAEPGAVSASALPSASVAPSTSASIGRPPVGMPPMKLGGFVALGVGAAGILGAVITGGVISSQHTQIVEECPDKRCSEGGRSLIDSQETLLPVNAAMWGIGIAGAAVGAVLLVVSSQKSKENRSAIVAPIVTVDGVGIGLSGRF